MTGNTKEVWFYDYCEKCKYLEVADYDDPCNECLTSSYNIDSHEPINFEEVKK